MDGPSLHALLVRLAQIDRRAAVAAGVALARQVEHLIPASGPLRPQAASALWYAQVWSQHHLAHADFVRQAARPLWIWAYRRREPAGLAVAACSVGRGAAREDTGHGIIADAAWGAITLIGVSLASDTMYSTAIIPCPPPQRRELARASEPVQVAWDLVAERPATACVGGVFAAHARAQRWGLNWRCPTAKAIACRGGIDIDPLLERILGGRDERV